MHPDRFANRGPRLSQDSGHRRYRAFHAARTVQFPPTDPAIEYRPRNVQLESVFGIGPLAHISGTTGGRFQRGNRRTRVIRTSFLTHPFPSFHTTNSNYT